MLQSRTSFGNTARIRSTSGVSSEAAALAGGLSVTGSLSNFSLYVFHPYGGGGQKKTSLAALESTFRKRAGTFLAICLCPLFFFRWHCMLFCFSFCHVVIN